MAHPVLTRSGMHTCLVLIAMLSLAACGKDGGAKSAPAPDPGPATTAPAAPAGGGANATAKAKEVFIQRCVPCHGATGDGDGPASASLEPKPRKFGDAAWQAEVTDDHIIKIVQYGGAAVGKAAAMPSNPDLTDPAVLAAIKDVVRSFATK